MIRISHDRLVRSVCVRQTQARREGDDQVKRGTDKREKLVDRKKRKLDTDELNGTGPQSLEKVVRGKRDRRKSIRSSNGA